MSGVGERDYLVVLDSIQKTLIEVQGERYEYELKWGGVSEGDNGEPDVAEKVRVEQRLANLWRRLSELQVRKADLERAHRFSGVEAKYQDALKVDAMIKQEAKKFWAEVLRTWTVLSHPALDPMSWIRYWIKEAADAYGVAVSENAKIPVSYEIKKITNTRPAVARRERVRVEFELRDIVTNRYMLDEGVRQAVIGTVVIHWNQSYPEGFVDRVSRGTLAGDHEASLTQHLAKEGAVDCIVNHMRNEMAIVAQAYLADQRRDRQYEASVRNFLAGTHAAKPVYANGVAVDRMFLIPKGSDREEETSGVLLSMTDKAMYFMELPQNRRSQVAVIEENSEWLRRHMPLSQRNDMNFTRIIGANLGAIQTPGYRKGEKVSTLSFASSSLLFAEKRTPERIIVDNHVETIRSNMDYMTTTSAELWVDWLVDVGSIAGLIVSLALIPAAIAGAPHMLAAALLSTTVTAVLPNIAKIFVNTSSEKKEEAVKQIVLAMTLEAIGYGVSKAVVYSGASIAKSSNLEAAMQTISAASTNIRSATGRAIKNNSLVMTRKSPAENIGNVSRFIDDLNIALELASNASGAAAPWGRFISGLADEDIRIFLVAWGVNGVMAAGRMAEKPSVIVRAVESVGGNVTQNSIDLAVDLN